MTVLLSAPEGWIVSHHLGSTLDVQTDIDSSPYQVRLDRKLFDIKTPFKRTIKSAKKKRNPSEILSQDSEESTEPRWDIFTRDVSALFNKIKERGSKLGLFTSISVEERRDSNEDARNAASTFFDLMKTFKAFPSSVKVNEESVGIKSIVFDEAGNFHQFIIPKDTVVHCADVKDLSSIFRENKFSLVVIDPPWRNKYVRRRKRKQSEAGYYMMEDNDIGKLPLKSITKAQAVIAVWCTNSKMHQQRILTEFFPSWGFTYVATWAWVKVTKEGLPICPFNEDTKKQPYEALILGRRKSSCSFKDKSLVQAENFHKIPTETQVIISVPSSIHSHKPPLLEVLRPYINEHELNSTNCCELFSRYAHPGFSCVGNEALKLMHESLYERCGPTPEEVLKIPKLLSHVRPIPHEKANLLQVV